MPQEWREAESHSTQSVIPMLAYAEGASAMDWLIRVFGFQERTRLFDAGGRLAHGELSTGGGVVMLASPSPDYEGPRQTTCGPLSGRRCRRTSVDVHGTRAITPYACWIRSPLGGR